MGLRLLVSMGAKPGGSAGELRRPLLQTLDADTGAVIASAWLPDPGAAAGDDAELTGAELADGRLWQCTRTAVLEIDPVSMAVIRRVEHPLFHDLHHVLPLSDGGFAVASSGNESVLRFNAGWELTEHTFLRSEPFLAAYDGRTDFRGLSCARFRPHSHHPNAVFERRGRLWATVWTERAAWELGGPGRLALGDTWPHDGRPREGLLWFTNVGGVISGYDPDTFALVERWELATLDPRPGLKGWCRGVEVVGGRLFVALTSLRGATHREVARWLLRGAEGVKWPTRLLEIDRSDGRIVAEHTLGGPAGATVYAINAVRA